MEFIKAPAFTRHLSDYLSDDEYRAVQEELGTNPELGDLMPSTGGFRKMRWAHARRGKGRQRWVANYLLPLQVGSSDMADDGFR
jgi:hypothetical protein